MLKMIIPEKIRSLRRQGDRCESVHRLWRSKISRLQPATWLLLSAA